MRNWKDMENRVYFLNILFEIDYQSAESLGDLESDLKRVGNYFKTLTEAKKAQEKILNALK